ncbi:MAG: PSD1 and planctomycete cytochrome C domain-containing protein, partial [Planctomycetota bacterium]
MLATILMPLLIISSILLAPGNLATLMDPIDSIDPTASTPTLPGENIPEFAAEIRPILSRQCLPCHGPDSKTRKADLRLDHKEGLSAVLDLQDPQNGELLVRITTKDLEDRMPPPEHSEGLSDEEISTLSRWIEAGAPWQEHWAFVAPQIPEIPELTSSSHPIDALIAQKLNEIGLTANQAAPPEILIRRAYLDLIGLPPEPERVARFIAEQKADPEKSWSQLIDELLASDSFGERWASNWLDMARYADTKGYEQDGHRNIWPWRDWLIRAIDADLPFDQFTLHQIAGDLLPDGDENTLLATGFHRNTLTNDEGGTPDEEYRVAAVVDRVNTTMQVWMGLTAGCAQCHDHKYEPMSQREYYQLFSIFNQTQDADRNDEFPTLKILKEQDQKQLVEAKELLQEAESSYQEAAENLLIKPVAETATENVASTIENIAFNGEMAPLCHELVDSRQESWPWIDAPEDAPPGIEKIIRQQAPAGQTRQVFYETSLRSHVIAEGDRYRIDARMVEAPETMVLQVRTDDSTVWEHRAYWGKNSYTNGVDATTSRWHLGQTSPEGEWAQFDVPVEIIGLAAGTRIVGIAMTQVGGIIEWGGVRRITSSPTDLSAEHSFEEFRKQWNESPSNLFPEPIKKALTENLAEDPVLETWWKKEVSSEGRKILFPHRRQRDQRKENVATIEAKAVSVPVMGQLAKEKERATHILERGFYLNPGPEVVSDVPAFLHPLPDPAKHDRLALAQWLVSTENPLTARVQVNRIWEQLFGLGLVETLEDLGTQGALPSHPELLDWLAVTWQQEDKWSLKALLRRIVTSQTYRRSNYTSDLQRQLDPSNRWLSRASRIRISAETMRDQALALGGILSAKKFGPPVYPPQPDGLWQVVYNGTSWKESAGEDHLRRSLYTYWRRTSPYPTMLIFDSPDRQVCQSRRIRPNTPLQALVNLNDKV